MKHLCVALICLMCAFGTRADNNNVATSKDYVDAQVETLQDEVPAIDSNAVLTHTGISGEIGSKKIYDANSDYGSQTDALVTAETFNSAIQNAIETEFVCIDWLGEHIPGNCLLWQINHTQPSQSPNLLCVPDTIGFGTFDPATGIFTNTAAEPKNYTSLFIQFYGHSEFITYYKAMDIYQPQTVIETFTTTADTHLLRIKHNDSKFDINIFFPVEPSTTYTLWVNAIETNPSIIGGMKLQLMLVRGESDIDHFIPCGNVYMPQN